MRGSMKDIGAPARSRRGGKALKSAQGVDNTIDEGALVAREIPIDKILVSKAPVRRLLGDIGALAESMHDYGLQQPVSVRAQGDLFVLTSGLRRLTAARELRWPTIPAFVRNVSADDAYIIDLIENLQREDLSPEEEADAFRELLRSRGWTVQQVGDAVKRSVAYVSKRVRVFEEPQLREAVARGMPVSTAEELLRADPARRPSLIERALAEHWDQVRARAMIGPIAKQTNKAELGSRRPGADARPRKAETSASGFVRAVREFHRLIRDIQAEELSIAEQAALRSLFRDLVMLARAPSSPRARVFPALPSTARPRRAASARSVPKRSARSK